MTTFAFNQATVRPQHQAVNAFAPIKAIAMFDDAPTKALQEGYGLA